MTSLKRAGRQVQRNPVREVTEARARKASECEKAREDADKDGGLSHAVWAVRFDVMSDDEL